MKLSNYLQDVGRPVAYFPKLRKVTGSTTATILLCQFIYWTGKEQNGDGWIYKRTQDKDGEEQSIEAETGLSRQEQRTARRILKAKGLLQEKDRRLEHRLYFRVNLDMLDELWEQAYPPERLNQPVGVVETAFASGGFRRSLNGTTETTPENTNHRLSLAESSASAEARESNQDSSSKDEVQEHPDEQAIKDIEEAFAEYAGLRDVPGQNDSRYTDWRRSYKVLAGICARNGISPMVLAVSCAMKRDEQGFSAGRPGAYIKTAENVAAAWKDPLQRKSMQFNASTFYQVEFANASAEVEAA